MSTITRKTQYRVHRRTRMHLYTVQVRVTKTTSDRTFLGIIKLRDIVSTTQHSVTESILTSTPLCGYHPLISFSTIAEADRYIAARIKDDRMDNSYTGNWRPR